MQPRQFLSSMRRWGAGLGVGLLAVALAVTGCDSDDSGMDDFDDPSTTLTLAQRVSNQDALSTLNTALGVTGQAETLGNDDATFTVFAPSNAGFGSYDVDALTSNEDLLSSVLGYHVVQGDALTASELEDGQTLTTVQGDELTVRIDDGTVFVEGARVTTPDVEATNGVAHVVDDVLLTNRTAAERLQFTNATETLFQAVDEGTASTLNDPDQDLTIFAPVNDGFEGLALDALTGSDQILSRVLDYHVISDQRLGSGDLPTSGETPATLEGGTIAVGEADDGTPTVNGIPVSTTDIQAKNAVIHLIDGVLLERLDVVQRATVTSALSTLATGVSGAGLASRLKGDGPFTVFAPTNDAFDQYNTDALVGENRPQGLLERILKYHVIPGQALASGDLSEGESPGTLESGTLTIGLDDGVTLNGRVTVTTADIQVRNGVVHLLDDVLLRRTNVVQRATVAPGFNILVDLVGQAGLAGNLSKEDAALTVFAPTDDAFLAALDANDNGEIDDDEVPANAKELLEYHVGDGVFYAADQPTAPSGTMIPDGQNTDVATLEGSNILVQRDGSSVTLNPGNKAASVAAPDVDVTNGVIHGIDTVLQIPSGN
ncbi:fasciclin domain-containing protein [Salinibacter altiplanensis]|uniref:fasciclin domain-containing protein n=1 Tax=Salinibacter altiplanensis TaxID=1803181 RepID=UPI000C9F22F7|nr:fasciclin domain-containing protein [Salinibacter altiplanensis]